MLDSRFRADPRADLDSSRVSEPAVSMGAVERGMIGRVPRTLAEFVDTALEARPRPWSGGGAVELQGRPMPRGSMSLRSVIPVRA